MDASAQLGWLVDLIERGTRLRYEDSVEPARSVIEHGEDWIFRKPAYTETVYHFRWREPWMTWVAEVRDLALEVVGQSHPNYDDILRATRARAHDVSKDVYPRIVDRILAQLRAVRSRLERQGGRFPAEPAAEAPSAVEGAAATAEGEEPDPAPLLRLVRSGREFELLGRSISLRPQPFAALLELAQHSGEWRTRHQIASKVEGAVHPQDLECLTDYVSTIRSCIKTALGDDREAWAALEAKLLAEPTTDRKKRDRRDEAGRLLHRLFSTRAKRGGGERAGPVVEGAYRLSLAPADVCVD